MKRILVMGAGQVGTPIAEIEKDIGNDVYILELDKKPEETEFYLCHVCIPFNDYDSFEKAITKTVENYNFSLCIIHSTIGVGTTKKLQSKYPNIKFAHSPIRGIHPNLKEGILTFVKFVGGKDIEPIVDHLMTWGNIVIQPFEKSDETEMLKLLDTSYYGWNILFAKMAKKLCDEHNLSYENVYMLGNLTYNKGYTELDMFNVVRPILYPPSGRIGGHCVTNNYNLLPDTPLKKIYKEIDEMEI